MYNNDFEYGEIRADRVQPVWYTEESVMLYRVNSIDDVLNDTSILSGMIWHHMVYQVPRLNMLESYYLNNNLSILTGSRRQDKSKADHRSRHAYADVISNFLNSYVLSNPVKVQTGQEAFADIIQEFNKANDIDSHNIEIGKDQNNMGRAFELIQHTENDEDRLYRLDPRTVFMIYDTTARTRVIGACRYFKTAFDKEEYQVELYTHEKIMIYKTSHPTMHSKLELIDEMPHSFSGVPIIEYRSDRHRMATYEKVIPQIDLYDAAQSDTANYMTDFNDAILAIEGLIKNAEDPEAMKKMLDANIIMLIPPEDINGNQTGSVKASYLTKSYDVAGVEAYKSRIRSDIFSISSTPDLSDEAFSGNKSGEALKYKLFGLEQKKSDKEKFLKKGFRIRYKLLENVQRAINKYSGDPVELDFIFTPNLPKAMLEELSLFVSAGGQVSNDTKLQLLSFVDDIDEENEKLKAERSPLLDAMTDDYGFGEDNE